MSNDFNSSLVSPREAQLALALLRLHEKERAPEDREERKVLLAELLMENGGAADASRGDGRHKNAQGEATGSPVIYPVDLMNREDDVAYWENRNAMAHKATQFRKEKKYHGPLIVANYDESSQNVWREVMTQLFEIHEKYGSRALLESRARYETIITPNEIPEMNRVNEKFNAETGMDLFPVEGLLDPHIFMCSYFAGMQYTNYIRHPKTPLFTPEPDLIHETGHFFLLSDPQIMRVAQAFAKAAALAMQHPQSAKILKLIEIAYWFALEYCVILENHGKGSEPRIWAAGNAMGIKDALTSVDRNTKYFDYNAKNILDLLETGYHYQKVQEAYPTIEDPEQILVALNELLSPYGIKINA